jgi:hypothetical protein
VSAMVYVVALRPCRRQAVKINWGRGLPRFSSRQTLSDPGRHNFSYELNSGRNNSPQFTGGASVHRACCASLFARLQLPAGSVVVAALWSSAGGSVTVESMRTNIPVCAGSSTSLPFFAQM